MKSAGALVMLKGVVEGGGGTLMIDARLKNAAEGANATRTTVSETTWIRSSPEGR
jgi:hypothetical protein